MLAAPRMPTVPKRVVRYGPKPLDSPLSKAGETRRFAFTFLGRSFLFSKIVTFRLFLFDF
uniref:Uncharacterized protein n=1 Tax=Utricularia reniformis TaxID=192314 RepID=A0A1Y0B137_9LAMI|nr:hypothetical protein AEK19_MT0926 [Utricularia reniformis]ART31152.1 hypothetical protein AEK19_MT0926 [Utricularia reniformis]